MEIAALYKQLANVEFLNPGYLWLIPCVLLIVITLAIMRSNKPGASPSIFYINNKQDNRIYFHPFAEGIKGNKTTSSPGKLPGLFYLCLLVVSIIALAEPSIKTKKILEPVQERDITFIVDTSVSMILKDYILDGERIDRMSVLKGVLQNFISRLQGDRMSIIVFGDKAYTLLPLTSDQALLKTMVSRIETTMAGRFNAIGDALALAVNQATQTSPTGRTKSRKRLLVLFSDADQPTSKINPELAAQLAKEKKLPVYSIAIGASDQSAAENRPGSLIYSPVDISLLEKISSETGGKVFRAKDVDALENAIEAISSHESNLSEQQPRYYYQPLYFYLLMTTLLAFILYHLVAMLFSFISLSSLKGKQEND